MTRRNPIWHAQGARLRPVDMAMGRLWGGRVHPASQSDICLLLASLDLDGEGSLSFLAHDDDVVIWALRSPALTNFEVAEAMALGIAGGPEGWPEEPLHGRVDMSATAAHPLVFFGIVGGEAMRYARGLDERPQWRTTAGSVARQMIDAGIIRPETEATWEHLAMAGMGGFSHWPLGTAGDLAGRT